MFKLNRFLSQEMLQQNKKSSKKKKFVTNNISLQIIFFEKHCKRYLPNFRDVLCDVNMYVVEDFFQ